jgi:hypothetical protein
MENQCIDYRLLTTKKEKPRFFLLCQQSETQQSLHLVTTPQEWLTLMQQALIKNNDVSQNKQDNYSALAVWMGSPQDTTLLHAPADAVQFLSSRD